MELVGVEAALDHAAELLDRARSAGIPIIHVQHDGGEPVILKSFPNAFVHTELHERLGTGRTNLVLAGFMTHMCVNSTARGAFNLGYASTVVASATATRALPGVDGDVDAAASQAASLAAVADMFAVVVPDGKGIPG